MAVAEACPTGRWTLSLTEFANLIQQLQLLTTSDIAVRDELDENPESFRHACAMGCADALVFPLDRVSFCTRACRRCGHNTFRKLGSADQYMARGFKELIPDLNRFLSYGVCGACLLVPGQLSPFLWDFEDFVSPVDENGNDASYNVVDYQLKPAFRVHRAPASGR